MSYSLNQRTICQFRTPNRAIPKRRPRRPPSRPSHRHPCPPPLPCHQPGTAGMASAPRHHPRAPEAPALSLSTRPIVSQPNGNRVEPPPGHSSPAMQSTHARTAMQALLASPPAPTRLTTPARRPRHPRPRTTPPPANLASHHRPGSPAPAPALRNTAPTPAPAPGSHADHSSYSLHHRITR